MDFANGQEFCADGSVPLGVDQQFVQLSGDEPWHGGGKKGLSFVSPILKTIPWS
jgi:hypothetical protein